MNPSDLELLLRMHRGDAHAGEALWRRFGARLIAYAASIVRTEAEDVVQGVFVSVIEMKRSDLSKVRDVTGWLVALTRRACLNSMRAARRERARRARAGAIREPGVACADDSVRAALESLPRRQREALLLRDLLGLSFDQMQTALGVPRSTAASRHQAARAALLKVLGAERASKNVMEVTHGRA